jgi:hypothetical protein
MAVRCAFTKIIIDVVTVIMLVVMVLIGVRVIVRDMIGKVCFVDDELVGKQ